MKNAARAGHAAKPRRRAGTAPTSLRTPEAELERRLTRWVGRAAPELGWKARERTRWQAKLETAASAGHERARVAARQLERLASRFGSLAGARETRRAAALLRVRGESARSMGATEALRLVLSALREVVPFELATGFRYDAVGGRLVPEVVEGSHVDLIPDIAFDFGAGFSSWVAKARRAVLLSTFREPDDNAVSTRPASFLSVPFLAEEKLFAVLNLAHRQPGAFSAGDRDLVVLAGALAAAALGRDEESDPTLVATWAPAST